MVEQVVSNICTYDIPRTGFQPSATIPASISDSPILNLQPSILHRLLKQPPQLLPLLANLLAQARRQHQHPPLRQRPLNQVIQMFIPEPQRLQPPWLIAQPDQKLRQRLAQHLARALALHAADVDAEHLRGSEVAVRVRGGGEAEDRGRGDGDADTVRDERPVRDVPRVGVARVLAADGVAHAVAEVDAGVAEADARERGRQQHLALGLVVRRVGDRARQVPHRAAQGLQREDVRDGVRALVGGAGDRVRGAGHPLVVGDRGPRLERVAEHVEARGGVHGRGHAARVQGVADAEGGLQRAVGDARFGFLGDEVEDGGAGRFRARAGGGGDGDQGQQGPRDGQALAERRVDEVEEVGVREAGVQVHELGGVDDGAAADGEEGVRRVGLREGDGFEDPEDGNGWSVSVGRIGSKGGRRRTSCPSARPWLGRRRCS